MQQTDRPNTPPEDALQALEMLTLHLFTYMARTNTLMTPDMFVEAFEEGIQSGFTASGPLTDPQAKRVATHMHWLTSEVGKRVRSTPPS